MGFRPVAIHLGHCGNLSPNMGKPLFDCSCSGLVLNHVPVLDEQPVLETNNIGGDPVHRRAKARETSMDNHEISPGEDDPWLILQLGWIAFDEIEQALSARLNMIAVLNVVR